MADNNKQRPTIYQITLQGRLDPLWVDWFEGLAVLPGAPGETMLRGALPDQAALHGVLKRVRDLGLPLLAVERLDPGQTAVAGDA
jgi:hypothetical protein